MSLSEFRRIDIRLDKANDYIPQRIYAKEGDANGRNLYVKITDNGEVVDTTGISLNLGWTHLSTGGTGLDSFTAEDLSQGIYKHSFTTAFLQPGRVECSIQIVTGTDIVNSRTFIVDVDGSTYDETAVESDNSFTALQDALLTVSSYDGRILNLENTKAEQVYVEGEFDRIDAQLAQKANQEDLDNKAEQTDLDETIQRIDGNETDILELNTTKANQTSLDIVDNKATDAQVKASNPLAALSLAGYKMSLDDLSNEVLDHMTGTTGITTAKGYFENNRGVEYPVRNVVFNGNLGTVHKNVKNAILDAKIFGAKVDCYYKLTMIGNGVESNGKARFGVTLEERSKDTFAVDGGDNTFIFIYNDDTLVGNECNADWEKTSDNIETITIDNGNIALSLTIDRSVITSSFQPLFLNLNSYASTAIIDPSNYFF